MNQPLRAPMEIGFDYTRSLGPTLSRFMTALADRCILGARGADGRVYAPPFEYDPQTSAPPAELVPVGTEGTVTTWSWASQPLEGQPQARPFAWALIRLDGADTAMLHAVDAGSAEAMRTGMRVRVRWAARTVGDIRDIACFDPVTEPDGGGSGLADPADAGTPAEPVTMLTTPVRLHYEHTASPTETSFLRGLADGRLLAQRCPACGKVYIPPRGACPTDGVPTTDEIELPDKGMVTTFAIINIPFPGSASSRRTWPPTCCSTAPTSRSCTWSPASTRTRCGWACASRRCGSLARNGTWASTTSSTSGPPASRTPYDTYKHHL